MPATAYQRLMDRAQAFMDKADAGTVGQVANGTVQLSVAPGVDVDANVGEFREGRDIDRSAYQRFEFGTITIRHTALAAARVTARPAAGTEVTVPASGKTYRIEFCGQDSTGYTLTCKHVY